MNIINFLYVFLTLIRAQGLQREIPHEEKTKDDASPDMLVVDTDAGADDALALLTLLGMERKNESAYKIKMITCVNGNTKIDNVVTNVLKILHTADRLDIPVYRGAFRPLVKDYHVDEYFGKDGFGDFNYPNAPDPKDYLKPMVAAMALIELVKENPGEVTILTLGPLTNIALAARLDENFLKNIKELVIMGGCFTGSLEFNSRSDPEANRIIYNTKPYPKMLMVPLETCRAENISREWRENVLGVLKSKAMWLINKSESVLLEREKGFKSVWDSADGVTAVILAKRDVATQIDFKMVEAEIAGIYGRGALFIDNNRNLRGMENIHIVRKYDVDKFKEILLKYLDD